jgi:hypothetical protein
LIFLCRQLFSRISWRNSRYWEYGLLKSYALPSEISMVLLVTLSKTSYHAKQ